MQYFSFGECSPSSGNPNPIRIVGIPRCFAKSPTIGIDPPDRINTVGFPKISLNAFAATRIAGWSGFTIRPGPELSTLTSH